ncbi:hypothetical protein KNT87_gp048 [Erwinia phage Cronus]|uniref:Uncharacterized protein n=1 Tax=Erwinia phage Cronus TaxID=2163633 RepID=A0A2S1GM69_9CAUD|nr:hypothetical protein KNT87_gp048 [Erwinia phage Cronus]AWD90487.1 hypothetical protein [Erwinia phage Cronus]
MKVFLIVALLLWLLKTTKSIVFLISLKNSSKKISMQKVDYEKIREQKTEMMRRFKESHDKALREGTITYRKI